MRFLFLAVILITINACSDSNDPKELFDQGKYKKSYSLWHPLATNGDTQAENYIAIHYYLGLGRTRDFKTAKEWFEKAAKAGHPDAQYNLGVMYENGEAVKKDYVTAYKWFYLAKEKGNIHAEKRMQGMAENHQLFPNQMKHAVEQAKEYSSPHSH